MRGRKLLALALCAALCVGGATPALGAEAADEALLEVTAKVKNTLGLDTDGYDDFQGWSEEDALLGKRWTLEWSGDGVSLSVTAGQDGKIYSYTRSESAAVSPAENSASGRLNIPKLPEDKSQAARETAQAFLNKVLETGLERAELENTYAPSLRRSNYRYSATVLLNGLPSPITCSVTVRGSDLQVIRFWRGDESAGYLGEVPGPGTVVTPQRARELLRSQAELEAKYVLQDDEVTARVCWVPLSGDDYYVDGATGSLVNLTELREKLWSSGGAAKNMMFGMTADAAVPAQESEGGLTQAEREGAAILSGALDKETLDRAVQNAWPEMGLDSYTLSAASYSISEKEREDGEKPAADDYDVTCRLTYGKQQGQVLGYKYVTVDAKTGELKSLYSHRYYQGEDEEKLVYAYPVHTAQAKADGVLRSFAGKHYGALGLYSADDAAESKGWEHIYTYQQTANGYFYSGNSYTVGVDATDGTLSRLSGSFDETVVLVTPAHVVSQDEAAAAYALALDVPFGYVEVPVSVSLAGNELAPLLKEAGYSYVLSLKTGYVFAQPENGYVSGVDAETGEAVIRDLSPAEERVITYDDLEDHWVRTAAQTLAAYQVGLRGGSLKPQETLTQLDMLALLTSVDGYFYDPAAATRDDTDRLYDHAYYLGLVTPETRAETQPVTRGELVRVILDAGGYGRIAAIPGIFRCDFADQSAIPSAQLGYAALAQGLGLVRGTDGGTYDGARAATRAEAVMMLYQYMK